MSDSRYARIKKVTRGKGGGAVLTPEQLKSGLDGQLFELARIIKEHIITLANRDRKHKLRRDGAEGFINSTSVEFDTDGIRIDFPEHAQYMDSGRRPGAKRVPLSALIKWLKRYRVTSRDSRTGKYTKSSQGSVNAAAYAIQQSIFKNGIKARPFIEESLEFAEQKLQEMISDVLIPEILTIVEFHFKKK